MDILELESAKHHWQSAADLMPQLICLLNVEGRIIRVNRTVERWGLGKVTIARGMALHDILHPGCSGRDCYFQRFWQQSSLGRLTGRRVEHAAFDPVHNRHFHIRVQPLSQAQPAPAGKKQALHTVVVVDDISSLKEAEAATQHRYDELHRKVLQETVRRELSEEMQNRLLTILEKTTDYVAIADAEEFMLYLNPAGRKMLGLGPEEDISGIRLGDHADPDMRAQLHEVAIPGAVENGLWSGESRMRDPSGNEIHTSQVIIAHPAADGRIDCFSTILRDMTERVKAEQALRESREELQQLSSLLVSVQEDERRRIALDLHDGLGQALSLIKLSAEHLAEQVGSGNAGGAGEQLRQIVARLSEALADVRRVATELRPAILDDLGLLPALSWFFREFEATCGQRIEIEKRVEVREQDVPAPLRITLYRILQEATSNVLKHAAASRMRVELCRHGSELHLLVEDDGRGFDPDCLRCDRADCAGMGLASMKERVSLSGGRYRIESSPGQGTRIRASWPLPAEAGEEMS